MAKRSTLSRLLRRMQPAARHGVPRRVAAEIIADYWQAAREELSKGEKLRFPGIGQIQIVDCKPVTIDPRTGKAVSYRKRQRVRFSTNRELLKALRVK